MSKPSSLKRSLRRPTTNETLKTIVDYAGIAGDPDEFGTDAYNFLDKPHVFIRGLLDGRDRLAREYTQTLAAIQIVAEGNQPPREPDSRAFDAVRIMAGTLAALRAQLAERDARLRSEREACNDGFNLIWQLVYPGKTDWEYPGMVYRHVRDLLAEIRAGRDTAIDDLGRQLSEARAEVERMRAFAGFGRDMIEWMLREGSDLWMSEDSTEWMPMLERHGFVRYVEYTDEMADAGYHIDADPGDMVWIWTAPTKAEEENRG